MGNKNIKKVKTEGFPNTSQSQINQNKILNLEKNKEK